MVKLLWLNTTLKLPDNSKYLGLLLCALLDRINQEFTTKLSAYTQSTPMQEKCPFSLGLTLRLYKRTFGLLNLCKGESM